MIPGYRSGTEKRKANIQMHCWIGHRQLIVDSVGSPECFTGMRLPLVKGYGNLPPLYCWAMNFWVPNELAGDPASQRGWNKRLCTMNPKRSAIIVWDPAQRLHSDSRRQGREGLKWVLRFLTHRSRSLRLQYTWHIWGMKGKMSVVLSWSGQRAGTRYIGVYEPEEEIWYIGRKVLTTK